MDINEIRNSKKEAEDDIRKFINARLAKFTADTGLAPCDVQFNSATHMVMGDAYSEYAITGVKIVVDI